MEILIIKLSAIGDVIHTLPSLRALKETFPHSRITWVVETAAADLLGGNPDLDRVIVFPRKSWVRNLKQWRDLGKTLAEAGDFFRALRDRKYDMIIDFHGLLKSAVLAFAARGSRKIGYDSYQELSGLFYTEKIPEDMNKHAVDRYLDFPRFLGFKGTEARFNIYPDAENERKIDDLLAHKGVSGKHPLVAASPQALWKTKLWDSGKFAALCDRIGLELGGMVVFTGNGAGEIIEDIRSRMTTGSVNLEGMTSLRDLAALFRRVPVVVTTDSGPMHLAAAVKTPVVAIFGPTSPERTGPYGEGHVVLQKKIACSPCFLKNCEKMQCMKEISVDEVFQAVKEILS